MCRLAVKTQKSNKANLLNLDPQSFDPIPGAEGVCKDRIYACMVLYAPFPLIWYATWLLSEKKNWPCDPI